MNKFTKKLIVAAVTVVSAVVMAISFTACGEGNSAAKLKGVYTVNPGSAGAISYKTAPMKLIEVNSQTIKIDDVGAYSFEVSTDIVTGLEAVTGTGEVINRGNTVVTYYGTYTAEEDSGLIVLTLAKPTRITFTNTDELLTGGFASGYFDTADWKDENTEALKTWSESWLKQDATAENMLDKFAFEEKTVIVSAEGQFNYVRVSYHNVILSAMGF